MTPASLAPSRNLARFWLSGLVLVLGLVLAAGSWKSARTAHLVEVNAYFDYRSRDALAHTEGRLRQYEQALVGARALFQAGGPVSRETFAAYIASVGLREHYPGIQGIGFAALIPASDLPQHQAHIRRQGFPDYRIRPEGQREFYSSIIYLEPFTERNLRAFGFDMFSEPVRREAMSRARDSGQTALSGKVTLVQETDTDLQAGFLMYLPVYQNGGALQSVAERRQKLTGWVYAPFRVNDFMRGVLGEAGTDLNLEIFDGPEATPSTLMFKQSPAPSAEAPLLAKSSKTLSFGDHSWTIVAHAAPGLLDRLGTDPSTRTLVFGGLISLLLGLVTFLVAKHVGWRENQKFVSFLNGTLNALSTHLAILDERGVILAVNRAWREFAEANSTGVSVLCEGANYLTACDTAQGADAEEAAGFAAGMYAVLRGEQEEFKLEYPCHTPGKELWFLARVTRFSSEDGTPRLVVAHTDITNRLRSEKALRESEERFRLMADHAPVLIWVAGEDKLCTYFNKVWLDFTGRTMAQELGNGWAEGVHPDDLQRCLDTYQSHFDQRVPFRMDYRLRSAKGDYRWLVDQGMPRFDQVGTFLGYIGSCIDITDRKKAEAVLRASAAHTRNLIETSLDPLVTISAAGKITDVNLATMKITGISREGLIGSDFSDYFVDPEKARAGYESAFSTGSVVDYPLAVRHTSGAITEVLYNASVYRDEKGDVQGVFAAARDITERKRVEAERAELEARNRQLQKAESLGLMAGSIAHHFNNKLQSVMASLELLGSSTLDTGSAQFVGTAKLAVEQAAEVSRLMLVYLGQSQGHREPCFLAELCRQEAPLLEKPLPPSIRLEVEAPAPGPTIEADAEQIRQILAQLVTNAREALGEREGRIRITTGATPAAEIPAQHRFPIGWQPPASELAFLEVADTGSGIAEAEFERLFDPFYSTKFTGRGLGLPVVLGLVQAHGGAITVASRLNEGSAFRAYFPLSLEAVARPSELAAEAPDLAGQGKLLLVDDDELLLLSTGALIELLGFTVLTAKDGVEALEVFQQHPGEIRCVISDLTMPRMDGWATLTALRLLNPALPVILASGFDRAQVLAGKHPVLPQAFLSKPFGLQELRAALNEAFQTDTTTASF